MKTTLAQLSVRTWLTICVALSILGSVIASIAFAVLNGANFSSPLFLPAKFEQLAYLVGYSLLINVLGAGAIIVSIALRKLTLRD